jgi:TRAP-type C4-dicarboxylate transport system permease small subunit
VSEDVADDEIRPAASAAGRSVERVIRGLALLGGVLLAGLALMQVVSIILRAVLGTPVPGDFELIQLGAAVVVFCYLPMAHYYRHNFSVTLFTDRSPRHVRLLLRAVGSAAMLVIAALLLWRSAVGGSELRDAGEHTMVLQLRIWWAFVPIVIALAVLVLAAVVVVVRDIRETVT